MGHPHPFVHPVPVLHFRQIHLALGCSSKQTLLVWSSSRDTSGMLCHMCGDQWARCISPAFPCFIAGSKALACSTIHSGIDHRVGPLHPACLAARASITVATLVISAIAGSFIVMSPAMVKAGMAARRHSSCLHSMVKLQRCSRHKCMSKARSSSFIQFQLCALLKR